MPTLTIVTFEDADGDPFPVAIVGVPASDEDAEAIARERIEELRREERRFNPTMPLTLKTIEYPELPS